MSITKIRENAVKKIMGPLVFLLVAALLVSIFVSFGSGLTGQKNDDRGPKPRVVFVAGDREVTNETYRSQLVQMQQRMKDSGQPSTPSTVASIKGMIVSQIVNQEMMAAAAEKAGVKVSKREMRAEVDKMIKQQMDQLMTQAFGDKSKGKTDADLDKWIKERNPELSVSRLEDDIRNSVNDEALKAQLLVTKYEAQIKSKAQLSDAELQDSYRANTVRHILISSQERPEATAKKRAEDTLAKLKGGADFATLAKEVSDDPGSAVKGGELPPVTRTGGYVAEFQDAALRLEKPGELTDLVKTQYGYHIIKLDKTEIQLPKDFEKNKKKYLKEQTEAEANRLWTKEQDRIRKDIKVEFKDPEFEAYWLMSQAQMTGSQKPEDLKKIADLFQKHIDTAEDPMETDTSYIQLAQLQRQMNKTKEAISTLEKGFANFEDAQARMMLATFYSEQGKKDKALENYKMAAEDPNPQIHFQLMNVFSSQFPNKELEAKSKAIVDAYLAQQQEQQRKMMEDQKKAASSNKGADKPAQGGGSDSGE